MKVNKKLKIVKRPAEPEFPPAVVRSMRQLMRRLPGFLKMARDGADDQRIAMQWRCSSTATGRYVNGHRVIGGKSTSVTLNIGGKKSKFAGKPLIALTRLAGDVGSPKPARTEEKRQEARGKKKRVGVNVLQSVALDEGEYGEWLGKVNAIGNMNLRPGRDDQTWRGRFETGMSPAYAVLGYEKLPPAPATMPREAYRMDRMAEANANEILFILFIVSKFFALEKP